MTPTVTFTGALLDGACPLPLPPPQAVRPIARRAARTAGAERRNGSGLMAISG
jgi:hypothetical protein